MSTHAKPYSVERADERTRKLSPGMRYYRVEAYGGRTVGFVRAYDRAYAGKVAAAHHGVPYLVGKVSSRGTLPPRALEQLEGLAELGQLRGIGYVMRRGEIGKPARKNAPRGSARPKRAKHAKRSRIRAARNSPLEVSGRDARRGGVLMSDEVIDLTYRHVLSSQSKPYRHPFGRGVRMYAQADGSILLKHSDPRRRLWEDRLVGDDA